MRVTPAVSPRTSLAESGCEVVERVDGGRVRAEHGGQVRGRVDRHGASILSPATGPPASHARREGRIRRAGCLPSRGDQLPALAPADHATTTSATMPTTSAPPASQRATGSADRARRSGPCSAARGGAWPCSSPSDGRHRPRRPVPANRAPPGRRLRRRPRSTPWRRRRTPGSPGRRREVFAVSSSKSTSRLTDALSPDSTGASLVYVTCVGMPSAASSRVMRPASLHDRRRVADAVGDVDHERGRGGVVAAVR